MNYTEIGIAAYLIVALVQIGLIIVLHKKRKALAQEKQEHHERVSANQFSAGGIRRALEENKKILLKGCEELRSKSKSKTVKVFDMSGVCRYEYTGLADVKVSSNKETYSLFLYSKRNIDAWELLHYLHRQEWGTFNWNIPTWLKDELHGKVEVTLTISQNTSFMILEGEKETT